MINMLIQRAGAYWEPRFYLELQILVCLQPEHPLQQLQRGLRISTMKQLNGVSPPSWCHNPTELSYHPSCYLPSKGNFQWLVSIKIKCQINLYELTDVNENNWQICCYSFVWGGGLGYFVVLCHCTAFQAFYQARYESIHIWATKRPSPLFPYRDRNCPGLHKRKAHTHGGPTSTLFNAGFDIYVRVMKHEKRIHVCKK